VFTKTLKTPKAIMDAARDESCTLNIPAGCDWGTETTVYCHFPDGTGGSNRLTGPLCGGFGCQGCHAIIDGRTPPALSNEDQEFYMRRSANRTINRLIERGLVTVKGLGR